jgi:dihydrofolate synthase/folylpolyglutamate synthase
VRYKEALDYLYGLQKFGIKFGLGNSRAILSALGNPEKSFKSIHVAGTNGKGSTTAAIAYILRAHGLKTGLFTSPHLYNFTERIRINGEEIREEEVIRLTCKVKEIVQDTSFFPADFSPTFFEVVTAIAFLYFKGRSLEWAAIETGMGGRLDSTNVIMPEAVVITPIGIDHKEFLGNTLKEITMEKAGIIKDSRPLILGPQKDEALKILLNRAKEMSSPVYLYKRDFDSTLKEQTPEGIRFDYKSETLSLKDIFFPLTGDFQAVNVALAIKAAEVAGFMDEEKIRKGLSQVSLPGRLELVARDPEVRLDGGHNPEAARALAHALKSIFLKKGRRLILLIGIMADKDIEGILKELLPLAAEAVFTAPAYGRAASPDELMKLAQGMGFTKGRLEPSVARGLQKAKGLARTDDLILVAGSFYTAGEAKEAFSGKGTLTGLREC